MVSQSQVIREIVNLDEELKSTYNYYQKLLHAINTKNESFLIELLQNPFEGISNKMNTARKSLKSFCHP